MENTENPNRKGFHLNKWFLDFISEDGEVMIFYAAKLRWKGIEIPYTSMLNYSDKEGVSFRSRMTKVKMPEKHNSVISWDDPKSGINGIWTGLCPQLKARLFDSDEGFLDWNCYQPMSSVKLKIKDRVLQGTGYAEQIIMTVDPWKIPMHELRWGRFGTKSNIIVWIEVRHDTNKQWIWMNGEKIHQAYIEDDNHRLPVVCLFHCSFELGSGPEMIKGIQLMLRQKKPEIFLFG